MRISTDGFRCGIDGHGRLSDGGATGTGAVVAADRTRTDDADSFKSPIRIVDFHGRIVYQS